MFAYGFLSVVLALYLTAIGLSPEQIGWLLTMALVGDVAISFWITTAADRIGRKRMLILGSVLMAAAGAIFAITNEFLFLIAAATIGVLSPSDKEVGPFLSIEQAALAQQVPDNRRTGVFAWYHLVGSLAAACGSLIGGSVSQTLLQRGESPANAYRPLVIAYAVTGVLLAISFVFLSRASEATRHDGPPRQLWFGLHRSRSIVLRLAALFALDAFGGGFLVQSMLALWFHLRFGMEPLLLGTMFFIANLVAAASALAAAALARRFGLLNTMVFTHLPSNVMLILVPLMPTAELAVAMFLLRCCISQMDIPTRQSYTMSVVHPDERSAASGITTVARSIGASLAPALSGFFLASPSLIDVPIYIAGGVKIVYDLWLYRAFASQQSDANK